MSAGSAGQPVGLTRSGGGSRQVAHPSGTTNLADLLERVLDKGVVIAGDITVSLGQIELLSIKLRLIVASIDKAQEIGIDWWKSDPALSSQARQLDKQNEQLAARLDRMENHLKALAAPQAAPQPAPQWRPTEEGAGRQEQQGSAAGAPAPGNTGNNAANNANVALPPAPPAPPPPVPPAGTQDTIQQ